MLQIVPQMKVMVALEPVDGRKGIDGLAQLCREKLREDPFSGTIFIFRNRRGTMLRILTFDGQGYWLATKRLSKGRFRWWPKSETEKAASTTLQPHQVQVLLAAGDPDVTGAPIWRPLTPNGGERSKSFNSLRKPKRMPLPG